MVYEICADVPRRTGSRPSSPIRSVRPCYETEEALGRAGRRTYAGRHCLFMAQMYASTAESLRQLNKPYSRVLRWIAGSCHKQEEVKWQTSDVEVRPKLKAPSIDCLVARLPLRYLGRIILHKPPSVCSLLQSRVGGKRAPWAAQAASDLDLLYSRTMPTYLPPPASDPHA